MRIKKFVGATLQDVTGQMKTELGSDAIILNTRKVHKGGILNFVGKEMFEITAAVDAAGKATTNTYAVIREGSVVNSHARQSESGKGSPSRLTAGENAFEGLANVAQEFEQRNRKGASGSNSQRRVNDMESFQELKGEVEEMKTTLREIAGHLKYSNMPSLPDPLKQAYITLVEQDVDEQIASDLVQSAYLKLGENALDNEGAVERYLLETLASMFRVVDTESVRPVGKKIVALVGPTGVGKTTTIAKLAAQRKLTDGLSVALISADTYRIGAIEQLQTFAAIADIPMEVVYAPCETADALKKFKDKDVIYIDTVGRSHYRKKEIEEVAGFVNSADPDEVHLVLGASTQTRTLLEMVERFSVLKPNRFVVTKTDEAASFGSLLGLMKQYPVPLSFVTTGQAVPDDIVAARAADLAMMVYRGVIPHA